MINRIIVTSCSTFFPTLFDTSTLLELSQFIAVYKELYKLKCYLTLMFPWIILRIFTNHGLCFCTAQSQEDWMWEWIRTLKTHALALYYWSERDNYRGPNLKNTCFTWQSWVWWPNAFQRTAGKIKGPLLRTSLPPLCPKENVCSRVLYFYAALFINKIHFFFFNIDNEVQYICFVQSVQ
jgi:hypothetical protein